MPSRYPIWCNLITSLHKICYHIQVYCIIKILLQSSVARIAQCSDCVPAGPAFETMLWDAAQVQTGFSHDVQACWDLTESCGLLGNPAGQYWRHAAALQCFVGPARFTFIQDWSAGHDTVLWDFGDPPKHNQIAAGLNAELFELLTWFKWSCRIFQRFYGTPLQSYRTRYSTPVNPTGFQSPVGLRLNPTGPATAMPLIRQDWSDPVGFFFIFL